MFNFARIASFDWPVCHSRLASFRPTTSVPRFCCCWRRAAFRHQATVDHIQDTGETGTHATAASPVQLCQLRSVPVGVQSWSFDGDCAAKSSRWHLHCGRWQTDLHADWSRSVGCIWHRRPLATDRTPAIRAQSHRHIAGVAAVLFHRPSTVR